MHLTYLSVELPIRWCDVIHLHICYVLFKESLTINYKSVLKKFFDKYFVLS